MDTPTLFRRTWILSIGTSVFEQRQLRRKDKLTGPGERIIGIRQQVKSMGRGSS